MSPKLFWMAICAPLGKGIRPLILWNISIALMSPFEWPTTIRPSIVSAVIGTSSVAALMVAFITFGMAEESNILVFIVP